MNSWDHEKDVDRALADLRRRLLSPDARRALEGAPGAKHDAVTRLGVALDEAVSALGRSARADEKALDAMVLLSVARERREWRHSPHPCERCGAVEVRVQTDDDSDDSTVWCYGCGHRYRVDGADSRGRLYEAHRSGYSQMLEDRATEGVEAIWLSGLAVDRITADAVQIVVPPVGGSRG